MYLYICVFYKILSILSAVYCISLETFKNLWPQQQTFSNHFWKRSNFSFEIGGVLNYDKLFGYLHFKIIIFKRKVYQYQLAEIKIKYFHGLKSNILFVLWSLRPFFTLALTFIYCNFAFYCFIKIEDSLSIKVMLFLYYKT